MIRKPKVEIEVLKYTKDINVYLWKYCSIVDSAYGFKSIEGAVAWAKSAQENYISTKKAEKSLNKRRWHL